MLKLNLVPRPLISCLGWVFFLLVVRVVLVLPAHSSALTQPPGNSAFTAISEKSNLTMRAQELSLEARVDCAKQLELVRWKERVWPEGNTASRHSSDAVSGAADLRSRVVDSLKMTYALEKFYGYKLDGPILQAELNRIARDTQAPRTLQKLFAALKNNPALIAECLVRPALARRLLYQRMTRDPAIHGDQRLRIEKDLEAVGTLSELTTKTLFSTTYVKKSRDVNKRALERDPDMIPVDNHEWNDLLASLSLQTAGAEKNPNVSKVYQGSAALRETDTMFIAEELIEFEGDRLKTRSVYWRKKSFDSWWKGLRSDLPSPPGRVEFSFDLPDLRNASREKVDTGTPDSWTIPIPMPRQDHVAVWTGSEMIVWGGTWGSGPLLDSGGRYDPVLDSWLPVSPLNAPPADRETLAVWTGTEMIVWAGSAGVGRRYDPKSDTWVTMATENAPAPRTGATGIWTGAEFIVWGGGLVGGPLSNSGARYSPETNEWTPTTQTGAPIPSKGHSAVWTGKEMIVWGGHDGYSWDTGGRYNPTTDSWQPTTYVDAPDGRRGHLAAWTGTQMIIWGGDKVGGLYTPDTDSWTPMTSENAPSDTSGGAGVWTGSEFLYLGGGTKSNVVHYYIPASDRWQAVTSVGAPSPRYGHSAIWTGSQMIVWGGFDGSQPLNTGGRYSLKTDSWEQAAIGLDKDRSGASAVWTGFEAIVWGGTYSGGPYLDTGSRYVPATNTWHPTSVTNAPRGRYGHSGVWTGDEMIIFGGLGPDQLNDGGRYDPGSDSWSSIATEGAPPGRSGHTAVWTGTEMIVWGGSAGASTNTDTGARYFPQSDSWLPTSTSNSPEPRAGYSAVWAGKEMIIWGGYFEGSYLATGFRYDPDSDSWTMTSEVNAPDARSGPSAVWTGEEVIIWGGYTGSGRTNTGARYTPDTDSWRSMSLESAPEPRYGHAAVWGEGELLVWGGSVAHGVAQNSGGRYDARADTWALMPSLGAPPFGGSLAVWSGEAMILFNYGLSAILAPNGAFPPNCVFDELVVRLDQVAISTNSAFDACRSVSIGPGTSIESSAVVEVLAGHSIVITPEFRIEKGSVFAASVDSSMVQQ